MSNEIPFRTDVPEYRTVINGVWSDIQNAWIASFEGNGENSEVRVTDKSLDAPLERGQLKTAYADVTLAAGESYAIELDPSTLFKIKSTTAKGLQIRYTTNITAGTLSDSGSMVGLNLTAESATSPVFLNNYSSVSFSQSDVLIAADDMIEVPLLIDNSNGFYVIITNNTTSSVDGLLTILGATQEELLGNFGLLASTELTPSTEMSTYNGIN